MKKIIGAIILAVAIIIGVSLLLNNSEKDKEKDLYYQKLSLTQMCLDDAFKLYQENWDGACRIENKGNDCLLPAWRADKLDADHQQEKDRCVNMYK